MAAQGTRRVLLNKRKGESDNEQHHEQGHRRKNGLYISRYYAKKAARGDEVAVKVCGGYKIMKATEYAIWRKQK